MARVVIAPAMPADMAEVARVFRAVRGHSLAYLPVLHSAEEDARHFSDVVFSRDRVLVARGEAEPRILGFIAFSDGWVRHLYLSPAAQGQGIGTKLLNMAQQQSASLQLWVFERNERAIRFYLQRGFRIIRRTDGEGNEEKEPDLLMAWEQKQLNDEPIAD